MTRPPRPGRSAPGSWRRSRTARRCGTRRSWSAPVITATSWRSSSAPARSRTSSSAACGSPTPPTSRTSWPRPDWAQAAQAAPARSRAALTATLDQLAAAAGDPAGAQAEAIVTILDPLIRARYPDAGARLADLRRLADAAAGQPSLHDALAELTLDPPVSSADLAGPPRLDEDYLTISTIHAAKGLEWPIVRLPPLVDGALPSDMALGDPGGLAEEHRLFYVAITRARDHLYLYAPQRLHIHRRGRDDRHGFGQLTRFLDDEALADCDSTTAAPLIPPLPATGSLAG